MSWTKSYIYSGDSLLSTFTKSGTTETLEFHHPDRLGTKLVTNNTANTSFEQSSLPFGTALEAESVGTNTTNRKFTTYDRSTATKLDYAVNRSYSTGQGRFTQVDPIGMSSTSLIAPQTLNLYSYCANDPINRTDPSGLFFGKLFRAIGKAFKAIMGALKWIAVGIAIVAIGLAIFVSPGAALVFLKAGLGIIGKILGVTLKSQYMIVNLSLVVKTSITIGLSGKIIGAAFTVGAIANSFNSKQDDTFTVPTSLIEFKKLVIEFFLKYGAKYRRCAWQIFSKDKDGNASNVANIMAKPSSKNFPYNKVELVKGMHHQGSQHQETGMISYRTNYRGLRLIDGTQITPKDNFFRVFAHEYGNYLSWYYTGDGSTFGVKEGILGDADAGGGIRSANIDDDTGSNIEKCVWGNVGY